MKLKSNNVTNTRGFSLVELMIAIALGSILLLAVTEIATRNSATRSELNRTAAQIDNGIYALRLLAQELSIAGYWGETGAQPVNPAAHPTLLAGTAEDETDRLLEIQTALGYPVDGGAAAIAPPDVPAKLGTDFILVRRASSCAVENAGCDDVVDGAVYLQVNACFEPNDATAPAPGDIQLAIASSDGADLSASLDYLAQNCTDPAPRYRLWNRVYFVDERYNLARAELVDGSYAEPVLLVENIETLRIEYGLDNGAAGGIAGDGAVDEYDAPVGAEWADVVVARVSLLARAPEASPGYVDDSNYTIAGANYTVPPAFSDFRRKLFSQTVVLRNIAERRQ